MHQRRRLLLDRLRQMRVAVAEDVDRDPRGEVQIALALFSEEIDSLAADRPDRRTRINGHERRDGHLAVVSCAGGWGRYSQTGTQMKRRAALPQRASPEAGA